jgi:hypothetical protein
MLLYIDKIFKDVIDTDAKYFINKFDTMIFSIKVICYVLSDMVLIS